MLKCKNFVNGSCEIKRLIDKGCSIVNPCDIDINCNGYKSISQCCWFKPDFEEKNLRVIYWEK